MVDQAKIDILKKSKAGDVISQRSFLTTKKVVAIGFEFTVYSGNSYPLFMKFEGEPIGIWAKNKEQLNDVFRKFRSYVLKMEFM